MTTNFASINTTSNDISIHCGHRHRNVANATKCAKRTQRNDTYDVLNDDLSLRASYRFVRYEIRTFDRRGRSKQRVITRDIESKTHVNRRCVFRCVRRTRMSTYVCRNACVIVACVTHDDMRVDARDTLMRDAM